MTLDEAIKHEEEIVKEEQYEYQECVATHDMEGAKNCRKYAEEHRQLAEWLKDYKRLLEQEPCEDCISRQSVEQLSRELVHTTRDKADFLCNFWEGLRKLPPVTPQQKMGRWIKSRDSYGNNHFTCSFCDNDIATKYDGAWKDNYCSNCGAKMQEVEENG